MFIYLSSNLFVFIFEPVSVFCIQFLVFGFWFSVFIFACLDYSHFSAQVAKTTSDAHDFQTKAFSEMRGVKGGENAGSG